MHNSKVLGEIEMTSTSYQSMFRIIRVPTKIRKKHLIKEALWLQMFSCKVSSKIRA